MEYVHRVRWLAVLLCAAPLSPAHGQGASFFDPFNSAINQQRWQVSDGWANGKWQDCQWSWRSIRVLDGGGLELSLSDTPRGDRAYSCGELMSRPMYGYGTFEVRMKPAALNPGIVSAFFTYTGSPHGNPHDEIDFEFVSTRPQSVDATYHAKGGGGQSLDAPLDFDPRSGLNDYAFHWTPDRIVWFVNGKQIREVKRADVKEFPTTPGKLYISIWNGADEINGWLGKFSYPGKPLVASYEYVAYTKLGEDCQFPQSIVCKIGKEVLNAK